MDRWIFGFRETGRRELTADELETLLGEEKRMRRGVWTWVFATALLGPLAIAGISVAVDGGKGAAAWFLILLAFVFALCKLSTFDRARVWARRSRRVGFVTRFERQQHRPDAEEDQDGEDCFEQELERIAGNRADWFETVGAGRDLYSVGGCRRPFATR